MSPTDDAADRDAPASPLAEAAEFVALIAEIGDHYLEPQEWWEDEEDEWIMDEVHPSVAQVRRAKAWMARHVPTGDAGAHDVTGDEVGHD
jgi:hypothetical protein